MTIHLLHSVGTLNHRNYHSRGEIKASSGVLTFDGPYANVYRNRDLLKDRKAVIFIISDWVGGTNAADPGKVPLEYMCTWDEIMALGYMGCELGWHTRTHRDLRKLNDEELKRELTPPFPMKAVAWPFGRTNSRVVRMARHCGFERGYCAGKYGDPKGEDPMRIMRPYL